MPAGENPTGPSLYDLSNGTATGDWTPGLIPTHAGRRPDAQAKPTNGAAPGRFADDVQAKNLRMVAAQLEKAGREGRLTAEDHERLGKFWPGPLNLGQSPRSEEEQEAARRAKISAMVAAAIDAGLIIPDEFTDPNRIENHLSEAMTAAAARKLVDAQEQAALEAQAAARRDTYPRPARTSELLRQAQELAAPIIWDTVTGEVAQRAGHTARLLADGKGGKTSVGLEWCRSALTGEPWLGHFAVRPVAAGAGVAFVDPELDTDAGLYLLAALAGCDEVTGDRLRRVDLVAAKAAGWTWASAADRDWLADQIAGCERLFADSILSWLPASGGRGEAAHSAEAVGEFLDQFKAMQRRAGVLDVLVGIHRAKSGSGSFGSIQWDAKFQALWSIEVEQDGQGVRRLRGELGRAGTRFREAEIAQQADGRLVFRAADAVGQILDEAERTAAALVPALAAFPAVMRERFWDQGTQPGRQEAVNAVNDALRGAGGAQVAAKHYSALWAAVERDGLAVLTPVIKGRKSPVLPPEES